MKIADAVEELRSLAGELSTRKGRLVTSLQEGVATAVVDNQPASNALTLQMMVQLAQFVQDLEGCDSVRSFILRAEGPVFCAGGHLGQIREGLHRPESGKRMALAMGTVLNCLREAPYFSVALVQGPAIGGGAELATATDFRIFSPNGSLRFAQAGLGVAMGWGGAGRLSALIGHRKALKLALTGLELDAMSAKQWGLADTVADDLSEATARLIAELSVASVSAARAMKQQIIGARSNSVALAADLFATVWGGSDHLRTMGIEEER